MPKIKIDYSSTLFYMIFCKDTNIKDLYIGHTTNFVQRKHAHKQSCTNTKSTNYPCKLYTVIRDNGGWANWKMQIIAFHECDDFMAAKKYEQQYFEDYDATLNSVDPMPQPKSKIIKEIVKKEKHIFHCNVCNMHFGTANIYETHNNTKKHIKRTLNSEMDETLPKYINKFYCDNCDYGCSKNSDFIKHTLSHKHQLLINTNNSSPKIAKIYECECGKKYKHASSLCGHKKKCVVTEGTETTKNEIVQDIVQDIDKELLIKMLLKNQDMMEKMLEKMTEMGNK